ncbi:MAG: amino acid adenylation domain-containing protein, partial [Gammaproteobacteria bacterium]|nr:amino acid adenylation domain-containing protein [Gammaproteobacteria bacterium]
MAFSVEGSERKIIIKNQEIQPEEIEAILLNYPSVIDCRVLVKECDGNGSQLVAYIVTKETFSEEKLHQFLKNQRPNKILPIAYISITNMPLTDSGCIDEDALRTLIVINDNLIESWDSELKNISELQQYAVTVQDKNIQCDPLHLQHLCPKWTSKLDNEELEDIDFEEGEASDVLALSDGGPLNFDKSLPQTLSEAFAQAQKHKSSGLIYVQQDGSDVFISYTELFFQAKKIVTGLEQKGLKANDVVILQLTSLDEFVTVFWACLLAGVIPLTVAIAPTYESKNGVLDKLFNAWDLLKRPPIISSEELLRGLDDFQAVYELEQLNTLSILELNNHEAATSWYKSSPEEIAFLQLSSGSTGVSKCIPETHRAVISHIQAATQVNQYHSHHVSLNWLPMDHVGPLLMYHVRDVYLGIRQVQVPPNMILNDPTLWLDYLEQYQVTHTWCANFGYKRVNDCLLDHPHKLWDLSSVQVFCNAGEQVTLSVLQDFILLTQNFQLNIDAIQPAYGMAEAATALTFCNKFDLKHHVHHIEKVSLNGNLSKVEKEDADTVAFIVQGPPSPGMKIRIVDKNNQILQERKIGHVQLTGETIMAGYIDNDEANQEAFSEDGWYNTGDLGFLLDGELTITGREKDLIVVYGANYYCADIEAVVNDIPGVLPTFVAATGVDAESGTEQLAIFFVPLREKLIRNISLLEIIKTQVTLLLGINPSYVIPLSEADFPKTTSGKIQRAKLKNHLLNGEYASILQEIDCYQRNENTLPNWFFKSHWRPHQIEIFRSDYPKGPYLIFVDEYGLGRSLAKELRDENECIIVEIGDDYEQVNHHHYRIVPNNTEHYHLLFTSLVSHHINVCQILHLWNYKSSEDITSLAELEITQKWVMCNFLLLIQNIIRHHDYEQTVQLYVVSSDTQVVSDLDKAYYERSTLSGLIKTLPQEVSWLQCRHIDIPVPVNDKIDKAHNASIILSELRTIVNEQEVAYRDGQRYIKRLKLIEFSRPTEKNIPLKKGGVYLVSGGLGHVGLLISQMLLERYEARLIIIGRTDLGDIQDTEHSDENIGNRYNAVQFLQQFPGDFRYYSVGVCDHEHLELIVQEVEKEWGRELDGILHLAGCEQQKLLKDETRESLGQILRPKVMGSWVLHQLLAKRASSKGASSAIVDKKLFIHFSSVSSHFGGEKSGAESAANAFQNSFSQYQNKHTAVNSLCFAWSRWHESVMGKSQRAPLTPDSGYHEMSQHQSILSFLVALQHQQKFLLIGLNGTKRRVRYQLDMPVNNTQEISTYFVSQSEGRDNNASAYAVLKTLNVPDCFQTGSQCHPFQLKEMPVNDKGDIDHNQLTGMHAYDATNTEIFVLASSETEQQLAWLWQDILAISQPSIHDNFFKLGGNSLQATVFTSRIRDIFHYDLSVQTIFKSPTIAEIAEILDNQELEKELPIPIIPRDTQILPRLSIGQERLWFLYQLAPDNPQYNIPVTVHIHGKLDIITLIKSFNQLIQRHEPLRTRFTYRKNQAVQQISKSMELSLSITDISGTPEQQKKRLREITQKETLKPFDITRLPLIRVKLYRFSDNHYVLFIVMHHIVADGWSMGVFFHDLTQLYKASQSGMSMPLLPLDVQYSDYAVWQRDWLSGDRLKRQLAYWTRQLDNLPVLNLIPDRPRTINTSNIGARHTCYIAPNLNSSLIQLGQEQEASLFMTLLAAFTVLCGRYTGQDDIAIGTGIANRNRREIEPLIGFFTNTLVMRGDLSGNPDFITVLQRIKDTALDAYEYQDLPFGDLVDALQPQREIGQNPLAQVVFVMQNSPTPVTDIPGIEFSPFEVESGLVKMDIEVNVYEIDGGLRIETEFNQELFDLNTIERMFEHYQLILSAITKEPHQTISTIPLLTPEEQQFLFSSESTITEEKALQAQCIHEVVEQVANDTPQAIAIIFEQQTLSYEQLNQKANQLARYLREQGVQKESLVGICIERSQEMIIALLAIFKAGGAYVPLDPAYPENRLQFILEDTDLKFLLTQKSLKDKLPDNQAAMTCIDSQWELIEKQSNENLNLRITGNNLAYIIFTSGSTGKPKGVLIEHKGLFNLAYAQIDVFDVHATDNVLQFSSLNFDASISEIAMSLVSGASLVMVNQSALMFGPPLLRLLQQECINVATIPPSVLTTLPVEGDFLPNLKTIIVAGEASNIELIKLWSRNRRLINAYGPTETSVCATAYLYKDEKKTPPIGKAIANTQVYLLDKSKQPVPVGIPGEIYIGGIGVARGYLNRPELTSERFIHDPFSSESDARMYCSGDLARYLPDGNIEYLGRIDQQIKIRGFRVEPGEIENRLREHEVIKEAFIHVNKSELQNPFLEAFVTQEVNKTENIAELSSALKVYLKEQLPSHMIPSSISVIEKIPLTPNGKLDYTQLELLKVNQNKENVSSGVAKIIPDVLDNGEYDETEVIIVNVIEEKLHLDEVSIHSHFFEELGGTSLGMVHIHKELEKQLNQEISLIDLFEYPTVAQLTQYLTKGSADSAQAQLLQKKMPERVNKQQTEAIAIIGMAGRFPGANNVDEFWDKLKHGEELIQKFTKEELVEA